MLRLGIPPATPAHRERWLREVSTVAAYRDRWHISAQSPLDKRGCVISTDQTGQRQRAQAAVIRAMALGGTGAEQQTFPVPEAAVEVRRGVEL